MKTLTKKQVERSCLLLAAKKQLTEFLNPPKRKKKSEDDFISVWSMFSWETRCKPFPEDLKKAAAKHVIALIDAELNSYGIRG